MESSRSEEFEEEAAVGGRMTVDPEMHSATVNEEEEFQYGHLHSWMR